MKKTFCCIISVLLFVSVFAFASSAASTEIIDKADITININNDGSVNVTEKWIVSYVSAAETFYRNIDIYSSKNGMSLVQKYDEVTDVAVSIDGVVVPFAESGINTYSVTCNDDEQNYEIVINCPSAQTTREYEITYTLTEAVKKSGDNAVFAYMVLGNTFRYTSNNVTATVVFPEGTEDIAVPDGSFGVIESNKVTFESKRVFDTFSVEVTADDSSFDKGALVSYSVTAEKMHSFTNSFLNILPWLLAVIAAVIIIILVLFPEKIIRTSVENKAKTLLKSDDGATIVVIPEGITACRAYKMLVPVSRIRPKASAKKVPALFAMAVLECMEKGYIISDGNDLLVGTPKEEAPEYILSVLNFLKTFCNKKGNMFVIDKSFSEKITAECMTRYDIITNYLATFYSMIPKVNMSFFRDEKNKEIYEHAYVVKVNASKIKHKANFAQCMGAVFSGKKTGSAEVFAMLCGTTSPEKLFAKGGRAGETALCEALDAMYNVFVKSK